MKEGARGYNKLLLASRQFRACPFQADLMRHSYSAQIDIAKQDCHDLQEIHGCRLTDPPPSPLPSFFISTEKLRPKNLVEGGGGESRQISGSDEVRLTVVGRVVIGGAMKTVSFPQVGDEGFHRTGIEASAVRQ